MPTIPNVFKTRDAVNRLVQFNNLRLRQSQDAKVFLDEIAGLNPAQTIVFDAVLVELGHDPTEIDALQVTLSAEVATTIAALSPIEIQL